MGFEINNNEVGDEIMGRERNTKLRDGRTVVIYVGANAKVVMYEQMCVLRK